MRDGGMGIGAGCFFVLKEGRMEKSDKGVTPPLPYLNAEFLKSQEARLIRILSEYIEPATRLRRPRIRDTIVFFGSARSMSPESAAAELELGREKTKQGAELTLKFHPRLARPHPPTRFARYSSNPTQL